MMVLLWLTISSKGLCSILNRGFEHLVEIDPDRWILFEETGIMKDITQLEHSQYMLWWYNNERDMYSIMVTNSDADEVYQYAMIMKIAMHLYVDPKYVGGVQVTDICGVQVNDVGCVQVNEANEEEDNEANDVQDNDVNDVQGNEANDAQGNEAIDVQGNEANVVSDVQVNEANEVNDVQGNDVDDVGGVKANEANEVDDVHTDENEDSDDSEDSDFEFDGLSFDDSEDERVLGFGMDNEVDINYVSHKLGSSDPNVSSDEKEPRYPRFKIEDLSKSYRFKVGLKFGTLDEFKEEIT
ncbi:unnamed protein product [Vicia faba]|uniref:Uncharacterized protein n=1 Tax=Vicia faba TaxID=3906 RepID=A0AAV0ZF83_VICFA|nr:unnamed protein product [Vicia faba]